MEAGILADRARKDGKGESLNGAGPSAAARGLAGGIGRTVTGLVGAAREMAGGLAERASRRARDRLTASLDARDPDFIRERLPLTWLLTTVWFRGEVRNLGNIPEDRPVLLVGNHSGGNMTPDTLLFTLAFSTYFGVERPFYQLAHNLVLAAPIGSLLRPFGTVAASPEHAERALEAGAAVLVYPGGDWEVHRPSWQANRIDFDGRKGFIRLALGTGAPIVPVVSIGGQETSLFLGRGGWLAKGLGLDRLFRLKVMPISIALPWGLNVGDFLGHLPLPAKLTIEVLPPIDVEGEFGPEPDIDQVYEHVVGVMQDTLDGLAAERRFPVIG